MATATKTDLVSEMFEAGATVTIWKGREQYHVKAGFLDVGLSMVETEAGTIRECLTKLARDWKQKAGK